MDAADHFTRRKCARNNLFVAIQHAGLSVNGHTAHRVMHAWGDADCVERAFVDWRAQCSGAAKIIVMLFCDKTVVALQRVEEGVFIHAQRFCQRFW
ncbi:hypothetical protein D3C72_877110 [compost metagenome]